MAASLLRKSNCSCGLDRERLMSALGDYRASWELTDIHLRRLCAAHPRHSDRAVVNAKLLIIGRAYATGIERKVKSLGSQGSSLSQVARCMVEHAFEVDAAIDSISAQADQLDATLLEPILAAHGALVDRLGRITRNGQAARSFVSKYLHFHRPVVPIIDSFAEGIIPRFVRWHKRLEVVPFRQPFDRTYYEFVMRFWHLLLQVRAAGVLATVKEMDYFLISEADHAWTR